MSGYRHIPIIGRIFSFLFYFKVSSVWLLVQITIQSALTPFGVGCAVPFSLLIWHCDSSLREGSSLCNREVLSVAIEAAFAFAYWRTSPL